MIARRRIAPAAAGAAVVGLLALNVTGIALVPIGPLGTHDAPVPDVAYSTLNYQAGRAAVYLTPVIENTWPVPVTIVRVTPVGTNGHGRVEVLGSLPFDYEDPADRNADGTNKVALGVQDSPGPGWDRTDPVAGATVAPPRTPQHNRRAFLVRITPDPASETTVLRFDVEYAIGPFHFVTTASGPVGTSVTVCPEGRPLASSEGVCVAF